MPSISDRLKSLGVKVGAQEINPPRPPDPHRIEEVLAGRSYSTPIGDTFIIEERYTSDYIHGHTGLQITAPLGGIATWAGEPALARLSPAQFAFIDTETTGLSGGTGTYAFLIGAGRLEGDEFHLIQFFMRDPAEEPAQLAALEEFLAPCQAVVTYNGKSFDLPLLKTRFIAHGLRHPFLDLAHIDLLHLSRRLWGDRLPSRTLGNIEYRILGARRTDDDIPGWMIPQMYFDYLRSGDARPLKGVFYHNAMDILSLSALLNHAAYLLAEPLGNGIEHGVDLIAMGKLFEDMGDLESATRLYLHGLEHVDARELRMPREVFLQGLQRLAAIYKRQEDFSAAVALWEQAASRDDISACIELAKVYEHRLGDPQQAMNWTQTAISLANTSQESAYARRQWLEELEHRRQRLMRRLGNG